MPIIRSTCFLIIFSFISLTAHAQSGGTNLLEFQYGKIPGEVSDPFASLYNRTTLSYRKFGFTASATLEQYYSEFSERNYTSFAQGLLRYKNKNWEFNLGNMYETLGRGVLLRAFEIKGAVIEDFGFRSRQYFHRDLLGGSVQYTTKKISIQLIRADVLNTQPPTLSRADRRTDLVNSLALKAKYYKKHKIGLHVLNHENTGSDDNSFTSLSFEGPLPANFSYFVEIANGITQTDRRALYGSLTGLIGPVSINLELKSYTDFLIGAGINEPPAGVQEQNYRVLNRSTHVSNPIDEDGYQLDLSYGFDKGLLVFNHALALNKFGNRSFTFRQFFVEWSSQINNNIDYKLFLDWSEDPLKGERNRFSFGLYSVIPLSKNWRLLPEIELQTFKRATDSVNNQSLFLGLHYKSKLTIGALFESTSNPLLQLDSTSDRRHFLGFNLGYKPSYKHAILLFAGERQGGPACSSGVCYEILDFKGFECRWTTRF